MASQGKRQCSKAARLISWIIWQHLCFILAYASPSLVTEDSLAKIAGSLEKFVDELPKMPTVKGYSKQDGKVVPAIQIIGMYKKKWKFHRDMPPTSVYAYGTSLETASVPGPTIVARSGVETYVQWENHLPSRHMFRIDDTLRVAKSRSGIPTVVHLHGSFSEPESDGHSYAWYTAGFKEAGPFWKKKVYEYSNAKDPGNLWYHDHAMGLTRLNLLAGLIGAYVIENPTVEGPFNLPTGHKYDRHLMVFDRSFTQDGSIYINSTGDNPTIHPEWQPEYFGDVIIVNGKAWPYLKVERRKYRFRIINASNARFYRFALNNGLPFTQIGSDSFYLEKPVVMKEILVAPSEIADVVVDFSSSTTDEILLTNSAVYPFPGGDPVNKDNGQVMKFIVEKKLRTADASRIPDALIPVRRLQARDAAKTRYIIMYEYDSPTGDPTHLLLNFRSFEEPATETPRQGTTELWHIVNLTPDNHPLHIHLAGFQVKEVRELKGSDELAACVEKVRDAVKCDVWGHAGGKVLGPPANEGGWKNVFKMEPSHITSILVRFSKINFKPFPFDASAEPGYVYHCHILDHEDNNMMRPMKILP